MKSFLLIGCILLNGVSCFAQNDQQFGIQSASITYVHSGSSYGTSILFFDDYGYKKAIQTIVRTDSSNGKILSKYYEVFIGNKLISEQSLDSKTKTCPTRKSLSNSMTTTVYTNEMLNNLSFFKNGECTVAGKICNKYCSSTDTICLWNGVVLKATMHLAVVSINIEATQIDLKPPPDSVFQIKTENYNF